MSKAPAKAEAAEGEAPAFCGMVVHFDVPELHDAFTQDDHLGALVRRGLLTEAEAVEIARREPAPSA